MMGTSPSKSSCQKYVAYNTNRAKYCSCTWFMKALSPVAARTQKIIYFFPYLPFWPPQIKITRKVFLFLSWWTYSRPQNETRKVNSKERVFSATHFELTPKRHCSTFTNNDETPRRTSFKFKRTLRQYNKMNMNSTNKEIFKRQEHIPIGTHSIYICNQCIYVINVSTSLKHLKVQDLNTIFVLYSTQHIKNWLISFCTLD